MEHQFISKTIQSIRIINLIFGSLLVNYNNLDFGPIFNINIVLNVYRGTL